MMSKILKDALEQIQVNPRHALKFYNAILEHGLDACSEPSLFESVVKAIVFTFLRFEDYIHSNNLLQVAKSEYPPMIELSWFKYATLQVITHRIPKYCVMYPKAFIDSILLLREDETLLREIEGFLVITIQSLLDSIDYFSNPFKVYVITFVTNLQDQLPMYKESIGENLRSLMLKAYVKNLVPQAAKVEKVQETLPEDGPIKIKDSKVMILIIGDVSMKTDDMYGIAKVHGVGIKQIEHIEFARVKNHSFNHVQHSFKYAGIILGPVPHSVKDSEGFSSLSTLFDQPGYPYVYRANEANVFKLTKQSLKKGLQLIIANFNSK